MDYVVGVVTDARTETLEDTNIPQIYLSSWQRTDKNLAIFLRGRLDPAQLPGRRALWFNPSTRSFPSSARNDSPMLYPALSRNAASPWKWFCSSPSRRCCSRASAFMEQFRILSAGARATSAIRIALGAQRKTILHMVLSQGLALALAGAAVGLAGALIVSHLMAGLLYGVSPSDPLTFISLTVVLVIVALAACYIPARRAMRVDPIVALREA